MDGGSGSGVSPGSGFAVFDRKCAKTSKLHPVAALQCTRYLIEHRADDSFDIPVEKVRILFRETLN